MAPIFEFIVRISLGWNYKVPQLFPRQSLWFRVLGQSEFQKIPGEIRNFRETPNSVSGSGICDVILGGFFSRIIARIAGAPPEMSQKKFVAEIERKNDRETWRRFFDGKLSESVMTEWNGKLVENLAGISFAYNISVDPHKISYSATKAWFFGIPLPRVLAPCSSWEEVPFFSVGKSRMEIPRKADTPFTWVNNGIQRHF